MPERALADVARVRVDPPGRRTAARVEAFRRWALRERVEAAGFLARGAGATWSTHESARGAGVPDALLAEGAVEEVQVAGAARRYPAGPRRAPGKDATKVRMNPKRVGWWGAGAASLAALAFLVAYGTSTNACYDGTAAAPRRPMKAIVHCDYGAPDALRLADVEKPTPADDEVLVRVRAAAVNPLDWHVLRGTPYVARPSMGLRRPKVVGLGVDFAGTVEAVGGAVTRFKPGDEVFGGRTGAFGEYVTVREGRALAPKPANVTFEQAAAVPVAAITALQGLRDLGRLGPGQKVLINGASGGVGTFAVQIAKALGAHVTGVCSTRNVELVRSIGADRVIDYTREDFTAGGERYDLILDTVGNRSLQECRRALEPRGTYVIVGGPSGRWIAPLDRMIRARLLSPFVSQRLVGFLAELNERDLATLGELMRAGKVTPVIDRRYPLADVPAAIRYLEEGHARGKVVVSLD